jgi:heptosyltransferase II
VVQKILIIKTGAAGDVVRTTSLLNVLHGNVHWIVDPKNKPIFPDQYPGLTLITDIQAAHEEFRDQAFDLILSLEENERCASLASSILSKEKIGVILNHQGITYNEQAAGWYDMSLISAKGKETANALKQSNNRTFQHLLFKMIGKDFRNEPYVIYRNPAIKPVKGLIGIESRVGSTWPNKAWGRYDELINRISNEGYRVKHFSQKENIRHYFDEIASCSCIISGDSLPMHIALAYQIPCLAIFNCTPPGEIHDYGFLTKIVSPFLEKNLYSRKYDEEVVFSIGVEEVYHAFKKLSLPK